MFSCFLIEYWSKTGLSLGTTAVAGQSTYMSQCRSYISGREPIFNLRGGGGGAKNPPLVSLSLKQCYPANSVCILYCEYFTIAPQKMCFYWNYININITTNNYCPCNKR